MFKIEQITFACKGTPYLNTKDGCSICYTGIVPKNRYFRKPKMNSHVNSDYKY